MMSRKMFLYLLLAVWPVGSAHAGDRWEECANIGGGFLFEGNKLYSNLSGKKKKVSFKKIQTVTLADRQGVCVTRSGARFSWSNHVYAMELVTTQSEGPFNIWFICEEGGSGFPASPDVDTKCVRDVIKKDKRIQPAYKDYSKK